MRLHKRLLLSLIGIIVFLYLLLFQIDFPALMSIIFNIDLLFLLVVILLIYPLILLKTLRWTLLMKHLQISYNLKDAFLVYSVGIFFGVVTPGRLGDLIKILYLQKEYPFAKSFTSVFLDRLFDMIVILIFGLISMLIFSHLFKTMLMLVLAILSLLSVTAILFYKKGLINKLLGRASSLLLEDKHRKRLKTVYKDSLDYLTQFRSKVLILPASISVICFLLNTFQYFILAIALGIPISYFSVLFCVSILSLAGMLPVTLMDIGTRDVILIGIFSVLSLSLESAIAFSLIILILIIISAVNGFLAWIFKPIELSLNIKLYVD